MKNGGGGGGNPEGEGESGEKPRDPTQRGEKQEQACCAFSNRGEGEQDTGAVAGVAQ